MWVQIGSTWALQVGSTFFSSGEMQNTDRSRSCQNKVQLVSNKTGSRTPHQSTNFTVDTTRIEIGTRIRIRWHRIRFSRTPGLNQANCRLSSYFLLLTNVDMKQSAGIVAFNFDSHENQNHFPTTLLPAFSSFLLFLNKEKAIDWIRLILLVNWGSNNYHQYNNPIN